ncbi:hypothetical protein ACHQM5_024545 [Ranunculus cassubicifolius]
MVTRASSSIASLHHFNPTFLSAICNSITLQTHFSLKFICTSAPIPSPSFHLSLTSCTSILHIQIIHTKLIKWGNYNDMFIGDQLVSLYSKFGSVNDALQLFDEIPSKDIASWNSIISGFSRNVGVDKCFSLFCRMRRETNLSPNEVTFISILPVCAEMRTLDEGKCLHVLAVKLGLLVETKVVNSLINMYGKCGCVDDCCRLFEIMCLKSLISWNSMIVVLVQNGFLNASFSYFNQMRRVGVDPDRVTFVTLLRGYGDLAAMRPGRAIHGYILSLGFSSDVPVGTALISLYSKCGNLDASHQLFVEMRNPDKVAWTAMLAVYAMHGHGSQAIDWFNLMVMEGIKPDHVIFTHVLNACSHSGLIEEGKMYFENMLKVYGITPRIDHYSCMVDLLGRSGLLEEAHKLITSMPMKPNAGVWGALIGACRVTRNVEFGKEIAERLIALDPSEPRNYIILSNIYCAAGQWKEASRVRSLMKERGLRKDPGCSFIEHRGKVHCFVVGDLSHPDSKRIHAKLRDLIAKIQEAGYVPDTELVLHDVDEDVKEDMIYKHSEKLAIVFGLLVVGNGLPIIITKNLRICGDCHSAAKFISLVEKRTIIVRDTKRFHHFVNGLCSCHDYW